MQGFRFSFFQWSPCVLLLVMGALGHAATPEFFRFKVPPGWTRDPTLFGQEVSYSIADANGETVARVTAQSREQGRRILRPQVRQPSVKDFDQLFLASRPKALERLGFGGWRIQKSTLKKLKSENDYLYQVHGTYREPGNQAMVFVEWFYFIGQRWFQFSWNQRQALFHRESLKQAEEVLARFEPVTAN